MTPERWQQVYELFEATLACAPENRERFLAERSAGDEELRREVVSLLDADEQPDSIFDEPLAKVAADLLADEPGDSLAGRILGSYMVEREIGRGGMGEVYLARDGRLDRNVALKLLPASCAVDPGRVRRFEQEALAASALNHPNIVTIHEVGAADGLRFIVTEYVEGLTLRALIEQGRLKLRRALDISIQTVSALAGAHEAGVIHRDIKPENVMVRRDGYVKVLDFGLAKLTERRAPAGESAPARLSTTPGQLLGTVSYMSPEQARGHKVDQRTDTFSFGVVLYEMVTGCLPFGGETQSHLIVSILEQEPSPLIEHLPDAPAELQRIVSKALRKKREERYQTAGEMLHDLQELKQELDADARRARVSTSGMGSSDAIGSVRRGTQTAVAVLDTTALPAGKTLDEASSVAQRVMARVGLRKFAVLLGLGLLLVAAAIFTVRYVSSTKTDSVAILPFTYTAVDAGSVTDPESEYISDGLSESIIRSLSELSGLKVIARSSAFRYKGREVDPRQVGRELNVRTVLTGHIMQRGETLAISAELVEAETGARLWGDRYEAGVADLIRVQSEIAGQISAQLRVRLAVEDPQRLTEQHTVKPEAYRLYLKGRYYWNKRSADGLQKAVAHFKQAIERDPDYALAYVALADAYSLLPLYSDTPTAAAFPLAREAALTALARNERLAEAHVALAWVLSLYDWDQVGAARAYQRALELNPNYALAHHRYGMLLAQAGRFDESLAELSRAEALDPVNSSILSARGSTQYFARRYEEAVATCRRALEMHPESGGLYLHLGDAYQQQHRYAEAFAAYQKGASRFGGSSADVTVRLAIAQVGVGNRAEALRLLEELRQSQGPRAAHAIAAIYAALGDKEQALAWLDKCFETREPLLLELKVEPWFDHLRSEPRFAEMLGRVGLAP